MIMADRPVSDPEATTDMGKSQQTQIPSGNASSFPALRRTPASIHTVPPELLSRIFELGSFPTLPDPDLGLLSPPDDGPRFEILVSHVCRHWRRTAHRTKTLWTRFTFREASHLDRAKAYLELCGQNQTLEIFVDTVSVENHIPGVTLCRDELEAVFLLMVPYVSRWLSFSLNVQDHGCKAHARKYLRGCESGPMLETISLYHLEDWTTSQELHASTVNPPVLIFHGILPRLRNVIMTGVNLPWTASTFLKNLEELELALHIVGVRPTYKEWHSMLTQSPHLKRLSLHYSGPQAATTGKWPEEPIPLLDLNELSLTDLDPDYLVELFNHLTIPAVKRLHLNLYDQDYTPFIEAISRPTAPVFRNLESLHVNALECNEAAWRRFLSSIPKLQFLYVDFRRVSKELFAYLLEDREARPHANRTQNTDHNDGATTGYGPNLSCIKFHGLSMEEIHRFDQSRSAVQHPLQRIYLSAKERGQYESRRDDINSRLRWFYEVEEEEEEEEEEGEEEEEEAEEEAAEEDEFEGDDLDRDIGPAYYGDDDGNFFDENGDLPPEFGYVDTEHGAELVTFVDAD